MVKTMTNLELIRSLETWARARQLAKARYARLDQSNIPVTTAEREAVQAEIDEAEQECKRLSALIDERSR